VVNPQGIMGTSIFCSVFYASSSDMPLNCLENCIDAENPKQFEDILR
jgi:hypothetical protein